MRNLRLLAVSEQDRFLRSFNRGSFNVLDPNSCYFIFSWGDLSECEEESDQVLKNELLNHFI